VGIINRDDFPLLAVRFGWLPECQQVAGRMRSELSGAGLGRLPRVGNSVITG